MEYSTGFLNPGETEISLRQCIQIILTVLLQAILGNGQFATQLLPLQVRIVAVKDTQRNTEADKEHQGRHDDNGTKDSFGHPTTSIR